MTPKPPLDLATFDGCLLDGLSFCENVYQMFDQMKSGPDGIANIRMRPAKKPKRLIEELLPIARYVQTRYAVDRRMTVRWKAGSQGHDAEIVVSGELVEHGLIPGNAFLEVTRAVHQNEYLVRRLVHSGQPSFGPKGTAWDGKRKQISSNAHARDENEIARDLAGQIVERLKSKALKDYPPNTILIIDCVPNSLVFDEEWCSAVKRVREAKVSHRFIEVFVCCGLLNHTATI